MNTLPSRYKVYRHCANDYVDEVLVSEHFDPAEAISACGKEMFTALSHFSVMVRMRSAGTSRNTW